jgi:hypothetical protein
MVASWQVHKHKNEKFPLLETVTEKWLVKTITNVETVWYDDVLCYTYQSQPRV